MRIIAGQGKGRKLKAPRGLETRPTPARLRQTLFDILAPELPGCRFLDLFAGAGGVGLEAASRGASRVVLVDRSRAAISATRSNLATLGPLAERVRIFQREARAALAALVDAGDRFDVVFLDPPYDSDAYERVLELLPGLGILDQGAVVVAQHFHKRLLPETIGSLTRARGLRVGDHRLSFYR